MQSVTTVIVMLVLMFSRVRSRNMFQNDESPFDTSKCSLHPKLTAEIKTYQSTADAIYNEATRLSLKGETYKELEMFVDTFGPRPSGSTALDRSLTYLEQKLRNIGLNKVHSEPVAIPAVKRYAQFAEMIYPRYQRMEIRGSGTSVPTLVAGIKKTIFFAYSTKYVSENLQAVRNKIVVFNDVAANESDWKLVENAGACAILLRAAVSFSIYSIFERAGGYSGKPAVNIPVAYVTNEDVDLMGRLITSGGKVRLCINLQQILTNSVSRNVVGELEGMEKSDEIVIISGHADTWDLSQGAQDDGIGLMLSYEVSKVLQKLQLVPKRTIRTVFWTGDEFGVFGAKHYVKRNQAELPKISSALIADAGCFKPSGFTFGGTVEYGCIISEILKLLKNGINATVQRSAFKELASDTDPFFHKGIPVAIMDGDTKKNKYYFYHHTPADTMSVVNSRKLDKCLALYATTAYVIADMKNMMPKVI